MELLLLSVSDNRGAHAQWGMKTARATRATALADGGLCFYAAVLRKTRRRESNQGPPAFRVRDLTVVLSFRAVAGARGVGASP